MNNISNGTIKNILKTIGKEFRVFKEEQIQKTQEYLFNNCGKIYAYTNLYEFFNENEDIESILEDMLTEEQLDWLNNEIEQPLSSLFDFYIDQEFMFVSNYDQIQDLLIEYVEKYYE